MPRDADAEDTVEVKTMNSGRAPLAGYVPLPLDEPVASSEPTYTKRERVSDLWTIFCSGSALISDGYQNSLMTMLNIVLAARYPEEYTSAISTRVSNALLVGEIIGQISIGLTCDYFGRKTAILFTTAMIVLGGSLATASSGTTVSGMFWMLTVARGIVGFGTGGEYPASSTSASESANAYALDRRGPIFILVTNLPLTFGGPLSVSVFLIVLQITTTNHLSVLWRVCFGTGVLLPLTVFYWRIRMLNSKLYRRGAIKQRVPYRLVIKHYWKTLLGTCGTWFLYDFVTIPNSIFGSTIIRTLVPDGDIQSTAQWQLLIGAIALPGVFIGALLCDIVGRKNLMMIGFAGYVVFGLIIGVAFHQISGILPLFIVFYGLLLSMGNLGPGDMLGLVSSESYATSVRGTCYGISAALGKTGAAIGTQVFLPIEDNFGPRWAFIVAAICGVAGIAVTYFFVPNLTGEDLSVRDEKFRAYLTTHGWQGMMGEDALMADASEGVPGTIVN